LSRVQPVVDERTILCESCGYDLTGLEPSVACPECGRSVSRSLPESRTGSPWQRRPGLWSWWLTNLAVVRSPRDTMGRLRIESARSTPLAALNCVLAGAILVAPWLGTPAGDPARAARGGSDLQVAFTYAWVFAAQTAAVGALLLCLTWCEYAGIRFIAARRGWRLTRAGGWQVCCHATVGWLAMALAPLAGLAILHVLTSVLRLPLGGAIDLRRFGFPPTTWGDVLTIAIPASLVLVGLFAYELLVHLGVRSNRYAARL
jgi:hypothetical protein